ncbi:MAG: Uma2 family endonuclease [Hyphomicrobiaceae bacterium]
MPALPRHKMTAEEFLAWSEAEPKEAGRFELWDGEVIVKHGAAGDMNAERSQHWAMKAALYRAFFTAVRSSKLDGDVVIGGASVPLPNSRYAEPDLLVYLGAKVPRDTIVVPEPVIICEVLSPATARFDLSLKVDGYFSLPSVQHYIIADPDKPLLIHHARGNGRALQTRIISDASEGLTLDPPSLTLDLTEIFAD